MTKSIILLSLFACFRAQAQSNFDAGLIPDSLKKNAHLVVRESQISFDLSSPTKAIMKVHEVMTILDPQGKIGLVFVGYSSSFHKLEDANILVYDEHGKQIQRIKQKDMSVDGFGEGLVDDGTATYFVVSAAGYPITVEKDYTETFKETESYPNFVLNNIERSIQESDYVLTMPRTMTARYHNHLLNLQPQISDADKDNRTYTWKATGIKAAEEEEGAPEGLIPTVYVAPAQFQMAGYTGDMSSWLSFGKWVYDLNKDALTLPEPSRQMYRDMVKDAPTDMDKARIIYHYLQKNFRYVSIQLGIGGQRSFPATFTEKKKYGDCKALSTYMCACLDAVGVKSYTALINSGERSQPIDPSFPEDLFDHVILCIPQHKDSVWLECTSSHTDFAVLGAFTENRNALLITEQGGVLVHTPSSTVTENRRSAITQVNLSEDGSGKADVSFNATGENKFEELSSLYEESHDNQKKYLVEYLDFPQPDDFSVNLEQVDSPLLKTHLTLSLEKVPEFTAGSKMFLNPRLYHLWSHHLPAAEHRTKNYYLTCPFIDSDTTCYQLPEGYVVDELPKGKTLSCPYASYTSNYWYDPARKAVFSYAALTLKERMIPASDFLVFRNFFSSVVEDETEKIVINKP
jgi:hypothetical protein